MRAVPTFAALAALLLSTSARAQTPPASADDPPPQPNDAAAVARQRYNLGTQAFKDKRYVEAALFFEAAAAERAHGIALFTAGLAWEAANYPERSADDFSRAIAVPGLPLDKLTQAKEKLGNLQSVLGRLEVTGAEGSRVQLDGFTEVGVPATLHGTAGVHTVTVRAGDKPVERRTVILQIGALTKLDLTQPPSDVKPVEPDKPAPAPVVVAAPAAPASLDVRKTLGFVALGVGGAALISGTILGIESLSAKDAYDRSPSPSGLDHAESLQRWTNITLIAGLVFAAGGAALVLWPSSTPRPQGKEGLSLRPTPGGLLLRGTF